MTTGYRALVEAAEAGAVVDGHFRKAPSNTTVANWWFDTSMMSGNPPPQYYASAPLESASMPSGLTRGIFRGDDVAPASKFLLSVMAMGTTAAWTGTYFLLDYLLYYPFVDGDSLDEQPMVQVDALPARWGDGVKVMAVALAPTVGGGSFTFNYVNQDGNPATSPVQTCSTAACNIASLVTAQPAVGAGAANGPFLALASGDTSVREITSLTMIGVTGGLFALVLVRPLATFTVRGGGSAPTETYFVGQRAPGVLVPDGAYLGLIAATGATVASTAITGLVRCAWV